MHDVSCALAADAPVCCYLLRLTTAIAAAAAAADVNNDSAVLLDLLTDVVVDYLEAQAHAGADILQVRNKFVWHHILLYVDSTYGCFFSEDDFAQALQGGAVEFKDAQHKLLR
jgi:Uroporphyrinogen decarboxylase (URO-D)